MRVIANRVVSFEFSAILYLHYYTTAEKFFSLLPIASCLPVFVIYYLFQIHELIFDIAWSI